MSEKPSQPTEWYARQREDDPTRGYLRLNCGQQCAIPLTTEGPKTYGNGTKRWGWNGDCSCPSVTPSIACEACGWHKTITNGAAQ